MFFTPYYLSRVTIVTKRVPYCALFWLFGSLYPNRVPIVSVLAKWRLPIEKNLQTFSAIDSTCDHLRGFYLVNIARGTTGPGYWVYNSNHFYDRNQTNKQTNKHRHKQTNKQDVLVYLIFIFGIFLEIWSSSSSSSSSVCIELVARSARVTLVKFQKGNSLTENQTQRSDPRTPGSDKKWKCRLSKN